jgi:hypothetical protein
MDNVSSDALYLQKSNIIDPSHTHAAVLDLYGLTTAASQHRTKADLETAAMEVRARTRMDEISLATVTHSGGAIKKGR